MAGIWGIVNLDETKVKDDEINRISEVYQNRTDSSALYPPLQR